MSYNNRWLVWPPPMEPRYHTEIHEVTSMTIAEQITATRNTLAEATKECLEIPRGLLECECNGEGRVPRFPGFRQECRCLGDEPHSKLGCSSCWYPGAHTEACERCNGTGWQIRAGGLEDALAGLNKRDATYVLERLRFISEQGWTDPMPSAPQILAMALELVIEVAGLTTHSPSVATITRAKYVP